MFKDDKFIWWEKSCYTNFFKIFKYRIMLNEDLRIMLGEDFHIFFVSSSFRARATNTQIGQEENSGYTFLEVYGEDGADVPPEIVVPPRDKTVVRGTTLSELHCIANARPLHALEILWFKDGRPIDEVGVPFSFNDLWNRTLSLFEADFKHQGVYTCQARMTTG